MKVFACNLFALGAVVNAHAIFQRISVNGADKGYLTAVRAPISNSPITDVMSPDLVCNTGFNLPVSSAIVSVAPGDKVGSLWQNTLGGPQGAIDGDNPIAASHKGPIMVYLAEVPNAAAAGTTGLKWFKVAQDTLTSDGKWGVDRMIANRGWSYFTMPTCVAPGNYLMRVELLALHSASTTGGAQFYMSCGQIKVTGSGSSNPETVSLPGAYKATDPGIQINIYDNTGQPTNGGRPYTAPGPAPMICGALGSSHPSSGSTGAKGGAGGSNGGSKGAPKGVSSDNSSGGSVDASGGGAKASTSCSDSKPTTTQTSVTQAETNMAQVALYGQCAGQNWNGGTVCAVGSCRYQNPYYSQCLN